MSRRMIRKVARFTVNLCDFMNGYYGKMIEDVVIAVVFGLPTMFFFMWFMIVMS
jgi:hypothetical protein